MKTKILQLSFINHMITFILTSINILSLRNHTNNIMIPTRYLYLSIYSSYFLDILSCYKGIIPFYRCSNTKDIYYHHIYALSLISLSIPSVFNIYSMNVYKKINSIISYAFVSSLNEAIMIYGVSYPLSFYIQQFELLFKIYLFSINAMINSKNIYYLLLSLRFKYKHIPFYILCFGGWSMYITMYPSLLLKSVYKYTQLFYYRKCII